MLLEYRSDEDHAIEWARPTSRFNSEVYETAPDAVAPIYSRSLLKWPCASRQPHRWTSPRKGSLARLKLHEIRPRLSTRSGISVYGITHNQYRQPYQQAAGGQGPTSVCHACADQLRKHTLFLRSVPVTAKTRTINLPSFSPLKNSRKSSGVASREDIFQGLRSMAMHYE